MTPKNHERSEVTAQDVYEFCCKWTVPVKDLKGYVKARFNRGLKELLSRARQEERHKYAKEVRGFMNESLEVAKESEIQRARQEARREALKEMDEAHVASEKAYQAFRMNGRCEPWASEGVKAQDVVIKLRQEYQSN